MITDKVQILNNIYCQYQILLTIIIIITGVSIKQDTSPTASETKLRIIDIVVARLPPSSSPLSSIFKA